MFRSLCKRYSNRAIDNGSKIEYHSFMKICSIEGCDKKHRALGYCNMHWIRFHKYGNALKRMRGEKRSSCNVELCDNNHYGLGYCKFHYDKIKYKEFKSSGVIKKPNKVCIVEGCGKLSFYKYCPKHYSRLRKNGDVNTVKVIRGRIGCSVIECKSKHLKHGYCGMHWKRFKKWGDVNRGRIRKYFVNDNLLKEMSKENCWLLGWIASDGYVNEKRGFIRIQLIDKEIIEKIKILTNTESPITERKRKKYNTIYGLDIYSKEMVSDLIKIGIRQNKSLTLKYPNIPEEFKYHFLRGVFEGDGSIIYSNKNGKITFQLYICSSSVQFIDGIIKNFTDEDFGLSKEVKENHNPVYRIRLCSKKALKFCESIYKDSEELKLNRKYNKYIEYKSYIENTSRKQK